jgi:hypothetical protein
METDRPTWRRSTYSGSDSESNCVEVALRSRFAGVRDSKNTAGPSLAFTPAAWRCFLRALRD